MSNPKLVLLHAPSNYDFRERSIVYGPISDVIPSSPNQRGSWSGRQGHLPGVCPEYYGILLEIS